MGLRIGRFLGKVVRVAAPIAGGLLGGPVGGVLAGALSQVATRGRSVNLGNVLAGSAGGLAAGTLGRGLVQGGIPGLTHSATGLVHGAEQVAGLRGAAGAAGGAANPAQGAPAQGGGGGGMFEPGGVLASLGIHSIADLARAGITVGAGVEGVNQANAAQRATNEAMGVARQDYASRAPVRESAITALTTPRAAAPDLGATYADPGNPFSQPGGTAQSAAARSLASLGGGPRYRRVAAAA